MATIVTPRQNGLRSTWFTPALAVITLLAVGVWLFSLRNVNLLAMTDLGLISVLDPLIFLALILLTISFCLALSRMSDNVPLILIHMAILVLILFGTAPILEKTPRTSIAWQILGNADMVMRTGTVDPKIDAFQNWPGFFIVIAFFTQIFGVYSPVMYAAWGAVFFNLLYLGPLYLLFRAGTSDRRRIWLAIWIFYLGNWVGQDYLAPQAFGFFIYVAILAILLLWFKEPSGEPKTFYERWIHRAVSRVAGGASRWVNRFNEPSLETKPWQRVGLLSLVVLLFLVIVPSHQLTPPAILTLVAGLVIFNLISTRSLPVFMAVALAAWVFFMASPFLRGHFGTVVENIGSVALNFRNGLNGRMRGSADHVFILQIRLAMTLVIWLFAFFGAFRVLKHEKLDLTFLLLAIGPFSLITVQSYGGEVLLRVFLFSLPFMAFWAAALFFPNFKLGRSWYTFALIGLVSIGLAVAFFFTRYGNERMDYFTQNEVDAVDYLYRVAEPNSQLIAGDTWIPWKSRRYSSYVYIYSERTVRTVSLPDLVKRMQNKKHPNSYLILTRGQKAAADLFSGWEPGVWDRFEAAIANSPDFFLIYSNPDAKIYVLNKTSPGTGTR